MTVLESNQDFSIKVRDLIRKDLQIDERITAVDSLTSEYINKFDKKPPNGDIALLTSYILKDELSNSNPHKNTQTEYNFLSGRQLSRRVREKEVFGLEEGDAYFDALISRKDVVGIDDVIFEVDFNQLISTVELTSRQRDILELLLVHGWTQQQIADELGISKQTVHEHFQKLRVKLDELKLK